MALAVEENEAKQGRPITRGCGAKALMGWIPLAVPTGMIPKKISVDVIPNLPWRKTTAIRPTFTVVSKTLHDLECTIQP